MYSEIGSYKNDIERCRKYATDYMNNIPKYETEIEAVKDEIKEFAKNILLKMCWKHYENYKTNTKICLR